MEAIVVLKDTMEIQELSTLIPICKVHALDSITCICGHYQADMAICNGGIWIALVICTTILLLTLSVAGMMLYYKCRKISNMQNEKREKDKAEEKLEGQKDIEVENEKKLYRERLLNYLELHGKDGEYVAELKSFINDFRPTEQKNGSMKQKTYTPQPIDTNDIQLPEELEQLVEQMSKNVHDVWAETRIQQGWTFGERRNDELKMHPCLIPYEELPDAEKEYDRNASIGTLKLIMKLGFKITR